MTKNNEKPEPLMTIKEVAANMKTSVKTVDRKIASGELPVVRIGRLKRIRPEDYRRFLLSKLKIMSSIVLFCILVSTSIITFVS